MPSLSRLLIGSAALCIASACDRKNEPPQPSAPAAPVVTTAPAPPAVPAGVRSAEVEALMASWQSAQNQGDFERYAALYDAAFTGVKRVGQKSFRFDRKGWLEDRRSLFQRDVRVVVRDMRIFTGERSAFAVFVQEWSSARFADVGQKRLEFMLRDGKLFVSREEMLESKTTGPGPVEAPPAEELALLVRLPAGYGAVLRTGSVEGTGVVRRITSESELVHRVVKDASPADIQPFQHLAGRSMDLYDGSSVACSGRITSFVGVTGVLGSDELGSESSPQGRADAIWEWADAAKYLAAVIEPERPCVAQWARASDLPKPTVFESRQLRPEESSKGLSALLETRAARDVQASYERFRSEITGGANHPATWSDREPREFAATLFADAASQVTYAAVELSTGEGCGDFGGYALGFFKVTPGAWIDVTGDGDPRASLPHRPYFGVVPQTAVATRPGKPPFLIGSAGSVLYAQVAAGFVPVRAIGEIRTICGC